MTAEGPPIPLGLLAAAGGLLLLAAIKNERAKAAAQGGTRPTDEVALHQAALAAVEQARTQIHLARRYADQLSRHSVQFDVRAKLEPAFEEPVPSTPQLVRDARGRQPMLFMVDGYDRLPALKDAVEQYAPPHTARPEDGSARAILRHAINAEGGLWSANSAYARLKKHGWRSDSERPENVVGNLLAAMARDGHVKRAGRGMYTSMEQRTGEPGEQEVAPGVFAREASPGVWIITGLVDGADAPLDSTQQTN
jgi:hypothetical protein